MDVMEEEQRSQILDRMAALAIDPMSLWLHFASLGGNADYGRVVEFLEAGSPLPEWDRTVLTAAARDLTM